MNALRTALLATAGLAASVPAAAQTVVAFGDSWAFDNAGELQTALNAAGYPTVVVANHAVPGSTALQYANDPTVLRNAVATYPDTAWVYLSGGGNDIIDAIAAGQGAGVAAQNDQSFRAILDNLFLTHPNVRVVMFGYDYTNFLQSPFCQMQLTQLFGANATQASVNQRNLLEVGQVMQTVAASYPNVTYVPLWGTLQITAGQTNDPNQPSPATLLRDCYHPNPTGARALMDALVSGYWNSTAAPTVTVQASAPMGCVGDTITVSAMTTGSTGLEWRVDGQPAGSANPLSVTLAGAGPMDVQARVGNAVWTAQAGLQLGVDPCIDAGFPDAGFPDTGVEPDAGFPDAGFPDAGFPDAGFPDTGVMPDAGFVDVGFPDSGVEPDLGFFDSGVRPDAGYYDGGVVTDAGVAVDAGAPMDAGVPPDAGPAPDAGRDPDDIFDADGDDLSIEAGCRHTSSDGTPPGLLWLAGFALLARRRRPR